MQINFYIAFLCRFLKKEIVNKLILSNILTYIYMILKSTKSIIHETLISWYLIEIKAFT